MTGTSGSALATPFVPLMEAGGRVGTLAHLEGGVCWADGPRLWTGVTLPPSAAGAWAGETWVPPFFAATRIRVAALATNVVAPSLPRPWSPRKWAGWVLGGRGAGLGVWPTGAIGSPAPESEVGASASFPAT